MSIQWDTVTDRIRAMVRASDAQGIAEAAVRLGISEATLRESAEGRSRLSSIKVIRALVRRGVDAKWMLTGEVDPALHRRMLDATPDEVEDMLKRMIADAGRTSSGQSQDLSRPH